MSAPLKSNIAIIGGGLASLTVALALHQRGIQCTIYEARPEDTSTPGALMLSPNSLRILDDLNIYTHIRNQGFNFQTVTFQNSHEQTTDAYHLGSAQQYGYDCLRIYRQTLLLELRAACRRAAIPIHYSHKFTHIVSEDPTTNTLTFALAAPHGTRTASLLIGADGIHSRLRTQRVAPGSTAHYEGRVAITYAPSRGRARLPAACPCPVAIHGPRGAFVLAPQSADGAGELLAGTQVAFPEQDRRGWAALGADKERLAELLREGVETWSSTVRGALADVPVETLAIWPYYSVPRLEAWAAGRVVVLGDAAHAIPPTAGQGASQALEDAVTFAALVGGFGGGEEAWGGVVGRWQEYRQKRVDRVLALTMQLNNTRLPVEEREKLRDGEMWKSSGDGELAWLYCADVVREMQDYVWG
ncbi:Monooxygenase FAD-binding protein [Botryosphaeria dothidea]|uniref:Monooxygenase FAD-binding protein n=1 Tax=Botryosphaeria dothidea TaxID=55169 RepID=A0A8H4IU07_9PEZI|nr:Monooxygenase FAD-binding protein [Botryosphaeria dothidea]